MVVNQQEEQTPDNRGERANDTPAPSIAYTSPPAPITAVLPTEEAALVMSPTTYPAGDPSPAADSPLPAWTPPAAADPAADSPRLAWTPPTAADPAPAEAPRRAWAVPMITRREAPPASGVRGQGSGVIVDEPLALGVRDQGSGISVDEPQPIIAPTAVIPTPPLAPSNDSLTQNSKLKNVPAAPLREQNSTEPPPGALVLLPNEELIMQLGALYLTNKRVILYAPTILRAAFLRDVDAVGTVTERSSGLMLFFGLLFMAAAAAAGYYAYSQPGSDFKLGELYSAPPLLVAVPLAVLALMLLASYFFYVKRSIFLSVGGRPLIVVSVAGWSQKRLLAVDGFINAFSSAKDRTEGDGNTT